MSEDVEIKIIVDPSLVKYFEDGMRKSHVACSTTEELTEFLALILNDTLYPISSAKSSDREIHLSYRAKSFADPIF